MLARGALCRLAVVTPRATHDLPRLARFLQRALLARNASRLPAVRAYASAVDSRRSYATTTRATKPTATVKKAVKAKAATKTATKAAPRKKAAPKKATPAKKKKTVAKKAAPKKAAPRKRVKKELSPEDKERAKITELRKKALRDPFPLGSLTAMNVFMSERLLNTKGSELKERISELSKSWKNITPAEVEHYNHLANEKNAAKKAALKTWVESYTPEQIRAANYARATLLRKLQGKQKSRPAHTGKIPDERHVKRPVSSFLYFHAERFTSGDFKAIKAGDASKLIAQEWKALSAGERKKYEDAHQADKARYARESASPAP